MSSIVKKTLSVGGNVCFVGSLEAFREHYPDKAASAGALIAAEGNKKVVGNKFASVPSFRLPECHDEEEARALVVYVPQDIHADKVTIHVGGAVTNSDTHNCHNLIILEKGAKALVEVRYAGGLCRCGRVAEAFVGEDAELEIVSFFDGTDTSADVESVTFASCAERGRFTSTVVAAGCDSFKDKTKVILAGKGAEAYLNGVGVGRKEQRMECDTIVEHATEGATSRQLYKMVADDKSTTRFNGSIYVAHGAEQTEAYQQNNNIVLSADARANALPQLEIYADDVKCSHGSTVGQLSEEALFYMRQRGIDTESARHLLVEAFVGEVISKISDNLLAEEIARKVRV